MSSLESSVRHGKLDEIANHPDFSLLLVWHYAAKHYKVDVAEWLMEKYPERSKNILNASGNDDHQCLITHMCVKYKCLNTGSSMLSQATRNKCSSCSILLYKHGFKNYEATMNINISDVINICAVQHGKWLETVPNKLQIQLPPFLSKL